MQTTESDCAGEYAKIYNYLRSESGQQCCQSHKTAAQPDLRGRWTLQVAENPDKGEKLSHWDTRDAQMLTLPRHRQSKERRSKTRSTMFMCCTKIYRFLLLGLQYERWKTVSWRGWKVERRTRATLVLLSASSDAVQSDCANPPPPPRFSATAFLEMWMNRVRSFLRVCASAPQSEETTLGRD